MFWSCGTLCHRHVAGAPSPGASAQAHRTLGRSPPGSDLKLLRPRSRDCGLASAGTKKGPRRWFSSGSLSGSAPGRAQLGGGVVQRGRRAPVLRRGWAQWGGIEAGAPRARREAPRGRGLAPAATARARRGQVRDASSRWRRLRSCSRVDGGKGMSASTVC